MALSKSMALSLLGVLSLSSGALASRELAQATSKLCARNPELSFCKPSPAPPTKPEETDGDVAITAEGPAGALARTLLQLLAFYLPTSEVEHDCDALSPSTCHVVACLPSSFTPQLRDPSCMPCMISTVHVAG
jgi:hypothetical protein